MKKIKINHNFSFISIFSISFVVAFVDLLSKYFIRKFFLKTQNVLELNNFLNLAYVENQGITFGFLSNYNLKNYLSFFVFIGIILIIKMIFDEKDKLRKLFLSFILGGAIGNFLDRTINGSVFDFIDFHYKSYHWYTFNIADSFISIGVFCLLFLDIVDYFKKKQ